MNGAALALCMATVITCCASHNSHPGKTTYVHHVHLKQPPAKGNSDLQLIKHLAHTYNRHTHHHTHTHKPNRPRNKRRPKPVYGPPASHHESSPPTQSGHDAGEPPYTPSQHSSFGEPPIAPTPIVVPSNAGGAADVSLHPSIHNLPIELNANGYMLPPSTSYGVPVAPIINVYPDKLEYIKSNQPPPGTSLYNILHHIQPQNAAYEPGADVATPNSPHLHFAEPLPDFDPAATTTFTTAPVRYTVFDRETSQSSNRHQQYHPQQFSPHQNTPIANNDDDDQYDDINNDDFRGNRSPPLPAHSSVLAKTSYEFGPNNAQKPYRYRSNSDAQAAVEELLLQSSSATANGSTTETRAHTLDSDELRDAYASDYSRFAPQARLPSAGNAFRFGQRKTGANATKPRLLGAASVWHESTIRVAATTIATDVVDAASVTEPILVLLSAQNNDSDTIADRPQRSPLRLTRTGSREFSAQLSQNNLSPSQPRRHRFKASAPHAPPSSAPPSPSASSAPQQQQQQQSLDHADMLQHIVVEPNIEILSIERSRSHSYYGGTMSPTET